MRTFHFGVGDRKKGGMAFKVEANKDNPGEVFLRCNSKRDLEALCNRLGYDATNIVQGRANACLAMPANEALSMICRVWEDNLQSQPDKNDPYTRGDRLGMGLEPVT